MKNLLGERIKNTLALVGLYQTVIFYSHATTMTQLILIAIAVIMVITSGIHFNTNTVDESSDL